MKNLDVFPSPMTSMI